MKKLELNNNLGITVKELTKIGLSGKFIFPPFSVLRGFDKIWLDRKRQWLNLGIKSERGRKGNLLRRDADGRITNKGYTGGSDVWINNSTSVFDPVLCELMYSWFCIANGVILDPFAGGSVRGVVAKSMGYSYWGGELRGEQVQANYDNAQEIFKNRLTAKKKIKISPAYLKRMFHPCTENFIKNICFAKCCESSDKNKGVIVPIYLTEQEKIIKLGGGIVDNLLTPNENNKCPFKRNDNLCSLHDNNNKPFGCIISPFTINNNDTLIVRNRYRLLKCYKVKEGKLPIYETHKQSLQFLFGNVQTDKIIKYIKDGIYDHDLYCEIDHEKYDILKWNDHVNKDKSIQFLIWVCGDSYKTLKKAPESDFIFTCPPYGNMEKYSDLKEDISNMTYERFIFMYGRILQKAINKLKENRFACVVVSNFRDKKTGELRNFVGDTIEIFKRYGMVFYNDIVYQTPIGSLFLRTGNTFKISRKIGKSHQNILIFYKGDMKKIKNNFYI
jgi:DNA modification methylase